MLKVGYKKTKEFLNKWKNNLPNKQVLYDYKSLCSGLLYEDQEVLLDVIGVLKKNIELWALKNSKVYRDKNQFYFSKDDLLNKKDWYVSELSSESQIMRSSGSTTGVGFEYLRWDPFLKFIECENHYDLILEEFNICNPHVLYLFKNRVVSNNAVETFKNPPNFMEKHGEKYQSTSHCASLELLKYQPDVFYRDLLKFLSENKIDVLLGPGSTINSLCHYIKKFNFKGKICTLLSNTNEKILKKDVSFLVEFGFIDKFCDHMRCWDGGATFITCKEKRQHLLDNLSWCEEKDKMLLSTDYFSLPSPFIRYWNGDYCKIGQEYSRCDCGRLYRQFEFLDSRPFTIKGESINKIKQELLSLNIRGIKQVRCQVESILLISSKEISEEDKKRINDKFLDINFTFKVEE
jgi:hypothetical protein